MHLLHTGKNIKQILMQDYITVFNAKNIRKVMPQDIIILSLIATQEQ
jgi:hypothetical protein